MDALTLAAGRLAAQLGREEGQGLVEWTLILVLVAVGAVAILGSIGDNVVSQLTNITNAL